MESEEIREYLDGGAEVRKGIDAKEILKLGLEIYDRLMQGRKLILMGNGGSAADAQHIAAEFVGKFNEERRALPAMALHTNTSSLTAIANDYDYSEVFARQIEAFAKEGDVVIGISTSGNSKNVLKAIEKANGLGCFTIGLTGRDGGKLKDLAMKTIRVNSDNTPMIQEVHITIGHILSKIVEDRLLENEKQLSHSTKPTKRASY